MLLEGLGKVSFVNGILRIQALAIAADGTMKEFGKYRNSWKYGCRCYQWTKRRCDSYLKN